MVSTLVKCGHPATSIYLDIDELRCRDCGSSLSFPARAPGPGDRADQLRDRRITQGEAHRVYVPMESLDDLDDTDDSTGGHYRRRRYPEASCIRCKVKLDLIPDPANSGRVECGRCDQVLVLIDADGQHRLPPFTPPRILPCACCKSTLPQFSFSKQTKMVNREGRNSNCRGCLAFKGRVRREQRLDEIRERDRLRMGEYWAKDDERRKRPRITERPAPPLPGDTGRGKRARGSCSNGGGKPRYCSSRFAGLPRAAPCGHSARSKAKGWAKCPRRPPARYQDPRPATTAATSTAAPPAPALPSLLQPKRPGRRGSRFPLQGQG